MDIVTYALSKKAIKKVQVDVDEVKADVAEVEHELENKVDKDELGSSAFLDVPVIGDAAENEVVIGSDSRLSDARTPKAHNHTMDDISDLPELGSVVTYDIPAIGDALPNEVVLGDDSRLTDSRTPKAHTHTTSEISDFPTLGTAAGKNWSNTFDPTSEDLVSGKAVGEALNTLPNPMIFKGSLGEGGTISELPAAVAANEGFTYKVITKGTYAGQAAKVGDIFTSGKPEGAQDYEWIYFSSGDEPGGTVMSIKIQGSDAIAVNDESAVTTSGVRTISHKNSGVDAGTYTSVTVDAKGHVTAGSNPKISYNDLINLPTLGTAAARDVPASGNANSGQVVLGSDTRLTNARNAADVYDWAKQETKPSYTASEIGLGNVNNTSDKDKPISTATQNALDNKVDKESGKGLSTNDYTNAEKNKLSNIASGAEVNVQSNWNETNTSSDAYILNKPTTDGLLTALPVWTTVPNDDTYLLRRDTGGAANYGQVKFSTIWDYIKGKTDKAYIPYYTDATYEPSSSTYVRPTDGHSVKFFTTRQNTKNIGISTSSAGGTILSTTWVNSSYSSELFMGMGDLPEIWFRGINGGSYIAWKKVAFTSDIPTKTSQLTNDSGFLTSHQDISGKVNKSGDTMTGTLNIDPNIVQITFRNQKDYYTTASYQTAGNEALVFATKNAVTSFMFINGEDSVTNHGSNRWQSLTPALQIKNNSVYIGSLIANDVTPGYKFSVNGTSYFKSNVYLKEGIYYEGTKATFRMIRFLDNTSSAYGNGISIGGGGQTIIGGGESADVMAAQAGTDGSEIMYIGNDGDVKIFTNLQDGWDSRKNFTFDTSGNLTVPNNIYGNLTGNVTGTATVANSVKAVYTGSGGQQGPGYYGKERMGALMSNASINGHTGYKNWIYVDAYGASDVGGATAIGVSRYYSGNTTVRAFIMTSDANRTSWNDTAEIITTKNIGSQSVNYATSAGSATSATSATTATKATQDGDGNTITSSYVRYKGNLSTIIGNGTPAAATKTYWQDNISNTSVQVAYNTNGDEYSILFGRGGSASYGSVLKWGYANPYLYILRRGAGSWKTEDWEKISAGYADEAGFAATAEAATTASTSSTLYVSTPSGVKNGQASSTLSNSDTNIPTGSGVVSYLNSKITTKNISITLGSSSYDGYYYGDYILSNDEKSKLVNAFIYSSASNRWGIVSQVSNAIRVYGRNPSTQYSVRLFFISL